MVLCLSGAMLVEFAGIAHFADAPLANPETVFIALGRGIAPQSAAREAKAVARGLATALHTGVRNAWERGGGYRTHPLVVTRGGFTAPHGSSPRHR